MLTKPALHSWTPPSVLKYQHQIISPFKTNRIFRKSGRSIKYIEELQVIISKKNVFLSP